ncbi:MAG: CHAT domain-containing protein [Myxococcales bacterium]|nr:CHAT domain-containing protein [Myxococcales bacterium]
MSGESGEEKPAGTRMARLTDDRRRVEPPAPEEVERAADAVEALPWAPARVGRTRVLFLVANSSRAPVNAEAEERKIRDRIAGGRFSFEKVPDVRAEDLFAVLRDQRPAMVHFSGHGHGAAGLAMKNRDGLPTSITARELALHFRDLAAQGVAVRCVVLNACLAEEQALAIAPYVDFVVGTTALVGDDVAVTFADNFYLALTEGRAVRQAFEAARARCGGDVAGAEGTFRLFYSEPRPPKRRAGVAVAVAALVAVVVAGALAVSGGVG